jgi:hypothetical protein
VATSPGHLITVPPGGKEGSNPAQTWWVCWLVPSSGGDFALNQELWFLQSFQFTADSDIPQNFCPMINCHVGDSNPAFSGIAVSPVQFDVAAGTQKIYTHGAGTLDPAVPQYTDVVQFQTASPPTWTRGTIYDVVLHVIFSASGTGYVQCWTSGHDGTSFKIADVHTPTFYNSDPGPLNLYNGLYTKGRPAENLQANNDGATFKLNLWQPRIGTTFANAVAATPLGFDHARGALSTPVFTTSSISAYDLSTFVYPSELGGGGGGGTPGGSTIGKATVGASWNDVDTPYKFANKLGPIPAGKTYTLSNPRAWVRGSLTKTSVQTQDLKLVIWDDGTTPGNVLNVGSSIHVVGNDAGFGTAADWQTFTFESAATTLNITAGGADRYFWAGFINQGTGNVAQLAYDAGSAGALPFKSDGNYLTVADGNAFGTPDGSASDVFSLVFDYVESPPPPMNTVAPSITGTLTVGATLTCAHGTWTNAGTPAYTYQWTRDGANIAAATASTHVIVTADVTHSVGCTVTNTDAYGAVSAAATPVIPTGMPPANVTAPTIDGTVTVGSTLAVVSLGTWTDNGSPAFTQQWQRDGVAVAGRTDTSYLVGVSDVGSNLRVAVTDTTADGSATAYSNAVGPITNPSTPVVPTGPLTFTVHSAGTLTFTPKD